jgi:hypothetical protein
MSLAGLVQEWIQVQFSRYIRSARPSSSYWTKPNVAKDPYAGTIHARSVISRLTVVRDTEWVMALK